MKGTETEPQMNADECRFGRSDVVRADGSLNVGQWSGAEHRLIRVPATIQASLRDAKADWPSPWAEALVLNHKSSRFSANPEGIASLSPGLRGTSYPGLGSGVSFQPQRGCGPSPHADATPLGLRRSAGGHPRVARASQPWALSQNPFGIQAPGSRNLWVKTRTSVHGYPHRLAPRGCHVIPAACPKPDLRPYGGTTAQNFPPGRFRTPRFEIFACFAVVQFRSPGSVLLHRRPRA